MKKNVISGLCYLFQCINNDHLRQQPLLLEVSKLRLLKSTKLDFKSQMSKKNIHLPDLCNKIFNKIYKNINYKFSRKILFK